MVLVFKVLVSKLVSSYESARSEVTEPKNQQRRTCSALYLESSTISPNARNFALNLLSYVFKSISYPSCSSDCSPNERHGEEPWTKHRELVTSTLYLSGYLGELNEPHPSKHCADLMNMADQLGKVPTKTSKECFFKGKGRAVLNIYGYDHWKYFFMANGRELTGAEADEIEACSNFENFNVEGTINVEWPNVTIEFSMNKFLGKITMQMS